MTLTSEYLQTLLTFPFRDAKWKEKLLVGSLIAFSSVIIPFLPQIVLVGYGAQMARRMVLENAEPHMPEWTDWGGLLMDGLRVTVARLVHSLPILLPIIIGYGGLMVTVIGGVILEESGRYGRDVAASIIPFGFLLFMCMFAVMGLFALPLSLILPAVSTHTAVKQEFSAAFRFGQWWPIFRANLSGYILGLVVLIALGIVVGFLYQLIVFTVILCFLLPVLAFVYAFYAVLVVEALFAQIYREGVQKLAAP